MATTLFGSSAGTPGITPAIVDSGWSRTSSGINRLAAVLSDSSSSATWSDSSISGIHSACLGQWIYGPLAAQSISGTVQPVIYGIDSSFNNIYVSAAAVWLAKPDGTLRATLLAKTNDPVGANWTTTMRSYNMGTISLTTQSATLGDYLIIEGGLNDPSFTNFEVGGIGAGGSRTNFTFSASIALGNTSPSQNVFWIGQPQPRRRF